MTAVLELVERPDDVESEPGAATLAAPARPAWRRHGWLVAIVPTAVLLAYQRLGPADPWPGAAAVATAAFVALAATVVLTFVRYRDDRAASRWERDASVLRAGAVGTTGTFTRVVRETRRGRVRLTGTVTWTGDDGIEAAALRPVRAPAPAEGEPDTLPRTGDPVAVWYAPGTDLVALRFQRGWADDLLAARG